MADPHSTIALLPLGPDDPAVAPAEAAFAKAFAHDLTGELSRFAPLDVIHPHSSFALAAEGLAPAALGERLGAGFLVGGRVRREGGEVRVEAELLEAASGRRLWGERFEVAGRELPAVEEAIAARVAAALALQIDATRRRRARRLELSDLEAYDLWVRGVEELRGGTLEHDRRARRLFQRARELDPGFARAVVGLSLSYFNDWSCQAWERWDENEARAFEHAREAVALDEGDAVAHLVLARVELYRRRFEAGARHLELALRLNPNDTEVLIQASLCKALLGEGEEAVALAERALHLHPLHPDWYAAFAALAHLIARRVEPGLAFARRAWGATVDLPAFVAAAHARRGERDEAAVHLESFHRDFREQILFGRDPEPGEPLRWILHVNPFRREEDAAHLVEGLRRAGLEADPDDARRAEPVASGAALRSAAPGGPAGAAAAEAAAPGAAGPTDRPVFREEGDLWTFAFRGERVQLAPVKGFRDLARLLAQPGKPLHAIELADHVAPAHDTDPLLDARARREIEERIRELQAEQDAAEAAHDPARAENARAELDTLVDGLARSLGLGGRTRRLGSAGERARTAVTWRIRSAIGKLARAHPALGRHLENAVRTGTTCVYQPEARVEWEL